MADRLLSAAAVLAGAAVPAALAVAWWRHLVRP